MNIYEAIKEDHEAVQPLLKRLLSFVDAERRMKRQISKEIQHALKLHNRAEEAVFYNTLRELDPSIMDTENRYQEHAHVEACLHTLVSPQTLPLEWRDAAEDLYASLKEHIQDEETRIFERAQKLITKEEADMLGEAFLSLKEELDGRDDLVEENVVALVSDQMPERFRGHHGHL